MPRVVHFEINADDPERAARFYTDVFGWAVDIWTGPAEYWLIDTAGGINGGIMRRMGEAATVNTIEVPSIDEFMKKVVKSGGHIITPKLAIPGVGLHAYCSDTEGNTFGLIERDDSLRVMEEEKPGY